jgi:hypothetical protein
MGRALGLTLAPPTPMGGRTIRERGNVAVCHLAGASVFQQGYGTHSPQEDGCFHDDNSWRSSRRSGSCP